MKQWNRMERRRPSVWAVSAFWILIASTAAQTTRPAGAQAGASPAAGSSAKPAAALDPSDARIQVWQAQVARDPEYWGSYNQLAAAFAQKARETGDISYFQLAESSLQLSLKFESTHAEAGPAFTQLASVHLAEHRFTEAGADALKAIALSPDDLAAYPFAGDAQLELGNYEACRSFYDRLAQPHDGRPHPGIDFLAASHGAALAWITGEIALASQDLQRAILLAHQLHMPAENIAWTEFMLGEQFFQVGDLVSAEREETASLTAFPRYHRALAAMGQIRGAQGRLADAIGYYQQAIEIIPLPLYVSALGDLYLAVGDKAQAEKQFALVEFIGRLNEINQQVYNRELAVFYADHDRKLSQALGLARKELEVRHDVYTSDALAWVLLKNGQPGAARQEIDRALRMGTQDALMEYHAGMIYAATGDNDRAVLHLQRSLAINPHFHVLFASEATKTLARLKNNGSPAAIATSDTANVIQR